MPISWVYPSKRRRTAVASEMVDITINHSGTKSVPGSPGMLVDSRCPLAICVGTQPCPIYASARTTASWTFGGKRRPILSPQAENAGATTSMGAHGSKSPVENVSKNLDGFGDYLRQIERNLKDFMNDFMNDFI